MAASLRIFLFYSGSAGSRSRLRVGVPAHNVSSTRGGLNSGSTVLPATARPVRLSLLLLVGFVVHYFWWIAAIAAVVDAIRYASRAWERHQAAVRAWEAEQKAIAVR